MLKGELLQNGSGCGENWRSLAGGGEDGFEFAGADYGVDFGDVFLDFVAVALDEAAGDDEALGGAGGFVLDHFEDGVDGLLLGGIDEGAGVDDEDFGVFEAVGEAGAGAVEQAHHDFESTRFLGQPRERKPTVGGGDRFRRGCSSRFL
jgi:hypothetical protein